MDVSSADAILAEMQNLGTEQARKTYKRHGVGANVLGVSYADLGKFEKKLKTNHAIALDLWNSGVHDAQVLACKTADPQQADSATLDKWVHSLDNYVMTDAFSGYAARTPLAQHMAEAWIPSDAEWVGAAGWNVLALLATHDTTLSDAYFERLLEVIERDIHTSQNRTRHSMNNAVIAIGARCPALQASAVAVAQRIGKVQVNHGLTNCKTPDAVSYIQKIVNRKTESPAPSRKPSKKAV